MQKMLSGYWTLAWLGLFANIAAIPIIALVVRSGPPLEAANLTLAISLAWPASIVGIVSTAGLFARKTWGVILSIIALSMALSGTLPYGIVRLTLIRDSELLGISGLSIFIAILNLLALIYWCRPGHRKFRL